MEKIKLERLELKQAELFIKRINETFDKLRKSITIEKQKDLEFDIYYFGMLISDLKKIYIRNQYKVMKEFDSRFIDERKNFNSDLMTTKKVKKDLIQEYSELEIQEMIIDWLEDRKKDIHRLADFINNERIDKLANEKRQMWIS